MARPSRSDEHLSSQKESEREEAARRYYNGFVPRRHSKPMRSEYSNQYADSLDGLDQITIPELTRLQDLEKNPEKLVYSVSEQPEEYVETEYYKDLNSRDKQHHMTGAGFIKMENVNGNCFCLAPESRNFHRPASVSRNPATNEWIPAAAVVIPVFQKPNRSEI